MKKQMIFAGIEARKEAIVSTMAASLLSLWILVRGMFYLPAEKIGAESAMLSTYREHTDLHVLLVYRRAMEMAPVMVETLRAAGLGSIYCLDLLLVEQYAGAAALLHDAGMGNPSEEASSALWAPAAEEPCIWVPEFLTGYVRKDIGKTVRKQHAAQSAMAALEPSVYRMLRAMALYRGMAALRIVLQDANRWPKYTQDCSKERVAELLTLGSEDADYRGAAGMPHAPVCLVVESLTKASHDNAAKWKKWAGQFSVPVYAGVNIDGSGGA